MINPEPQFDFGQDFKNFETVERAKKIKKTHSYSGTSFRITYNHNKKSLWYSSRTSGYETDWDYFFAVSLSEAEAIVNAGLAHWDSSLTRKPIPQDDRSLLEKISEGDA